MNDFSVAQAFTPRESKVVVSKAPINGLPLFLNPGVTPRLRKEKPYDEIGSRPDDALKAACLMESYTVFGGGVRSSPAR